MPRVDIRCATALLLLAACGGDTVLVTPGGKGDDDTGEPEAPADDTGDTGAHERPCPDADGDTICDDDDRCPGEDDRIDGDGDLVPDCLDACPEDPDNDADGDGVCAPEDPCPEDVLDDRDGDGVCDSDDPCPDDLLDDSDGDTVCDSDDLCPGGDDRVDADGDGTPDHCEVCRASGGWTQPDTDGDGLPDDCLLSILLIDGHDELTDNTEQSLLDRGWTVDRQQATWTGTGVDFTAYDVVAVSYEDALDPFTDALTANAAGDVGMVVHRGTRDATWSDMTGTTYWQDGACSVTDDGHFITAPFGLGALDVGYTYKTVLESPTSEARALVGCTAPSTAVHTTYRRAYATYYGHGAGMPWSDDGALLDTRTYAWATGFGAQ